MNYKNRIQKFIKHELWKISNSKSICTSYDYGYKQALIDIECLIMNIDNENELIGKWGYFWMDERIVYHDCTYGKLLDIKDIGGGYKIYITERSLGEYNHFSLTIPKHLK